MKISKIEIEGFRGVRERLSISLPTGFVVIVGRNGVGKSTICDAIEFALTGTISRHRLGSEKGEGIDQYLWWRGIKPSEDNSVSVTLSDKNGREYKITRRPNGIEPDGLQVIRSLICAQDIDPTKDLADACRTSIIRDELITDLSVDMSEGERFEFVRAAVGSANLKSLEDKLAKLQVLAAESVRAAERDYDRQRERVVQIVAEVSRLRSDSPVEHEIDAVEKRLRNLLNLPQAPTEELLSNARQLIAEYRLRTERANRLLSRINLEDEAWKRGSSSEAGSDLAQARKKLEQEEKIMAGNKQRILQLQQDLSHIESAAGAVSSLAELHFHGSKLGLQDGRCPLCGSAISEGEFREHLHVIEDGLQESAVRVIEFKSQIARLQEEEERRGRVIKDVSERVQKLEVIGRDQEAFRQEVRMSLRMLGVDDTSEDIRTLISWLENQSKALAELETAVVSIETAQGLSRVADRTKDVSLAQNESLKAELQLERAKQAAGHVKAAIDSLKRFSGEIVDERLAAISPLLEELYSRLRPHVDWPEISYLIRGDVRRLLSLRVGDGLNLRYMFSSGQRRAAGLAFLLAVSLSRPWCGLRTLVLDDPVQHIDDYRALHLTETLTAVRKSGFQVICTVEDSELGALLSRRLRSTEQEAGLVVEMNYEAGEGGRVLRQRPVLPFPTEVLRSA